LSGAWYDQVLLSQIILNSPDLTASLGGKLHAARKP
jgi:hypothetical protein